MSRPAIIAKLPTTINAAAEIAIANPTGKISDNSFDNELLGSTGRSRCEAMADRPRAANNMSKNSIKDIALEWSRSEPIIGVS